MVVYHIEMIGARGARNKMRAYTYRFRQPCTAIRPVWTWTSSLLVDVEVHLVGAERVGQGEGIDAHRL